MKNQEINEAFEKSGIKKWQAAEVLGIADTTFSKKLRKELSEDEKQKILTVIEQLKIQKGAWLYARYSKDEDNRRLHYWI